MINCPNCNAPLEPYKCKCEYCGSYFFDFSGADLTGDKPCYIKVGNTVALAHPHVEEIASTPNYDTYEDVMGTHHYTMVSRNITARVLFDVIEYKERINDG